jgi:hypothetical protein
LVPETCPDGVTLRQRGKTLVHDRATPDR